MQLISAASVVFAWFGYLKNKIYLKNLIKKTADYIIFQISALIKATAPRASPEVPRVAPMPFLLL